MHPVMTRIIDGDDDVTFVQIQLMPEPSVETVVWCQISLSSVTGLAASCVDQVWGARTHASTT